MITIREHYRTDYSSMEFDISGKFYSYDELMSLFVPPADTEFDQEAAEDDQHFRDWLKDVTFKE